MLIGVPIKIFGNQIKHKEYLRIQNATEYFNSYKNPPLVLNFIQCFPIFLLYECLFPKFLLTCSSHGVLEPACAEIQPCTYPPNSVFSDTGLGAWNQPWWEHSHHGNQQTLHQDSIYPQSRWSNIFQHTSLANSTFPRTLGKLTLHFFL